MISNVLAMAGFGMTVCLTSTDNLDEKLEEQVASVVVVRTKTNTHDFKEILSLKNLEKLKKAAVGAECEVWTYERTAYVLDNMLASPIEAKKKMAVFEKALKSAPGMMPHLTAEDMSDPACSQAFKTLENGNRNLRGQSKNPNFKMYLSTSRNLTLKSGAKSITITLRPDNPAKQAAMSFITDPSLTKLDPNQTSVIKIDDCIKEIVYEWSGAGPTTSSAIKKMSIVSQELLKRNQETDKKLADLRSNVLARLQAEDPDLFSCTAVGTNGSSMPKDVKDKLIAMILSGDETNGIKTWLEAEQFLDSARVDQCTDRVMLSCYGQESKDSGGITSYEFRTN